MKVLITGASGMVASRFVELYSNKYELLTPSIKELDITNDKSVQMYANNNKSVQVVINFAAYTNVGKAEEERELCYNTNYLGTKNLTISFYKTHFIQISTDFVFGGYINNAGPYKETDRPLAYQTSLGWYGWTKLLAEIAVKNFCTKWNIVRISYPFRKNFDGKLDFARNIIELDRQNKLYPMFIDQYITPTNIDELCIALDKLIEKIGNSKYKKVFHVASSNKTTPNEFASVLLGKDVEKSSFKPVGAKKPQYGGLSVVETERQLGIKFKTWQESIKMFNSGVK